MVLFVGDKPSRLNTDPSIAFKGARCEPRLMEWIEALGIKRFHIVNQSDTLIAIDITSQAMLKGVPIVALGNNASKWLGRTLHFKLPHPSGRNRQINDKAFIIAKLEECKKYLENHSSSHDNLR